MSRNKDMKSKEEKITKPVTFYYNNCAVRVDAPGVYKVIPYDDPKE